jgi:hypothetical protein
MSSVMVSIATVILFFKSGMFAGLRMRTKLEQLLFCSMWETYYCMGFKSRNGRLKPLQLFSYTLYSFLGYAEDGDKKVFRNEDNYEQPSGFLMPKDLSLYQRFCENLKP